MIATGACHSLLLTVDGLVYSFGSAEYGQLGCGDLINRKTPVLLTSIPERIVQIGAGSSFSVALAASGTLYVCGKECISMGLLANSCDYRLFHAARTHCKFVVPAFSSLVLWK